MSAAAAGSQRRIADLPVSALGLGGTAWSLEDLLEPDERRRRTDEDGVAAIDAALDAGITLLDTARAYTTATHPGHSETLFRRALSEYEGDRSAVVLATKGGHYRHGDEFPVDASPEALRSDCTASRSLLGVERIDLYQLHHPDPEVPIKTAVGALAELREEGWIRHIGVSNFSLIQLDEALSVAPIASVQNQFSPLSQDDRPMVDFCAEHSIAYLAYSPLGGDPRLGGARLEEAFPAAAALASRRGVSPQRLALAWLLSLSPTLIPICGASRPASIRDSALAMALELSEEELAELDFGTAVAAGR